MHVRLVNPSVDGSSSEDQPAPPGVQIALLSETIYHTNQGPGMAVVSILSMINTSLGLGNVSLRKDNRDMVCC